MDSNPVSVIFCLFVAIAAVSAQGNCQSPTYTFSLFHNTSHQLDLTTPPNQDILTFDVSSTISVTANNSPYLAVKVANNKLIFTTTQAFANYEKNELELRISLVLNFVCASGQISGLFFQELLVANNHDPTFAKDVYEATVPLPLPKGFDLTPFLDEGRGIVASDYDLRNNQVEFTVTENDYLVVGSVPVPGNGKQFKAVLTLKEQVLKLPGDLELVIVGKDKGDPPRTGQTRVVIKPNLTIEYNDPPAFKQTFYHEDYDADTDISLQIELVPGTVHKDIRYELLGDDVEYFETSVAEDKSSVTVLLKSIPDVAKGKYFLSVVVQAKRTELQFAQCVILVDLNVEQQQPGSSETTVEKVLSVLELEEEKEHEEIFGARIKDCNYEILSQKPNALEDIFRINESTNWVTSSAFDREDRELFADLDIPQFHIILQLNCSKASSEIALDSEVTPKISDIPYSTVITHLSIIVKDINDNAPVITFPKKAGQVFAFPVANLVDRLFLDSLLLVTAYDLDAGLNAEIRFSLSSNDHFGINPKIGIIYPLKQGLSEGEIIDLEITATDCDGSSDGLQSKMSITIIPALLYQLSVLQVDGVDLEDLENFIAELEEESKMRIDVLQGGYTCAAEDRAQSRSSATTLKLIVVAFDSDDQLVSTKDFAEALGDSPSLSLTPLEGHVPAVDNFPESDCTVYPFVVVMSVFIVLFVAACALSVFFYYKLRLMQVTTVQQNQTEASTHSGDVLVENPVVETFSTPPEERKGISGVTVDYSSDSISRSNNLAKTLSTLLEDDEVSGDAYSEDSEDRQRKKSIRFNEDVERIEVY